MLDFYRALPPEGAKILLVLALSFLTGLEREEHHAGSEHYSFGGVRTFPLIGLIGYAMAFLSGGQFLAVAVGFAVVAGFLMLAYQHKVTVSGLAGFTSEMSALTTYLAGALVYRDQFWIATTISVASMLLLELKAVLEGLTKRFAPGEIFTFRSVSGRSAGVPRPILDRHHDQRGQHAIAGIEGRAGRSDEALRARRNLHLHQVPAAQRRDPAGAAESGVRPVPNQSLQGMAGSGGGEHCILWQLCDPEGDQGEGRRDSGRVARRRLLFHRDHHRNGQAREAGATAPPFLRRHAHRFRRDVLAVGGVGGAVQSQLDCEPVAAVSGAGGRRRGPGLVVDAASRRQGRNCRAQIRAEQPAGTAGGVLLRRALSDHADRDAPGGDLPGPRGGVLAGAAHGMHGRGPVYYGHDTIGRICHPARRGRRGHSDCRSQQQSGQGDLRLLSVGSKHRHPEPMPAVGPGAGWHRSPTLAGKVTCFPSVWCCTTAPDQDTVG